MKSRTAIAYVVEVDGPKVLLNFREGHKGQVTSHLHGFSVIGQPDDLLGVDVGTELIVLRIESISFAEPKEAHRLGIGTEDVHGLPLRQIKGVVLGFLICKDQKWIFTSEEWHLPPLGSEAFPLSREEARAIYKPEFNSLAELITLGKDPRDSQIQIQANLNDFLSRHVAILGSTGQGKTHFIAALLQQLVEMQNTKIVVFDVNGEYSKAFEHLPANWFKKTILGSKIEGEEDVSHWFQIPYFALGRQGLARLLLPSEKTQLPALRFAIENLKFVSADKDGARLAGVARNCFFDDCRKEDAKDAFASLEKLREKKSKPANAWPHMRALSCLIAEWSCLNKDRYDNPERNAFHYGNVSPLVNRIRGFIEDDQFRDVVIVDGSGSAASLQSLSLKKESKALVDKLFGEKESNSSEWKIHVIDLRRLTQDLMPFILGSLLELYASELFKRGPGGSHPTLLVLEEAHHYLRPIGGETEFSNYSLAYERLAKEGRKFGLSMLISTQRPSEISPTVLAQCGTWCVFRLTNERDQRSVSSASEFGSQKILKQIPGLPRGNAVILGASMRIPVRVQVIRPEHEPDSIDAQFYSRWSKSSIDESDEGTAKVDEANLDSIFAEDEIPF